MTIRLPLRSTLTCVFTWALLSVASTALAQNGTVTGTVTNAATAAAIANVTVEAYTTGGALAGTGFSNGSGQYSITLPAGSYKIKTAVFAFVSNFADEVYDNIACSPTCDLNAGTAVVVSAGGTTTNIHFSLTPGGTIDGTVTRVSDGTPIDGVTLYAYSSTGAFVTSTGTGPTGQFSMPVLAGTYYVETVDAANQNFVDELYNNLTCRPGCSVTTGTGVVVTSNASTSNVNFALAAGGSVTGTVTATGSGLGIAAAKVALFSTSGALVREATTSGSGSYTIAALPAGSFRVRTVTSGGYIDEAYNNVSLCAPTCATSTAGTAVVVTAGNTTSNIDFSLAASTELLQNGNFSNGTTGWQTFATPDSSYMQSSLVSGVFYFRRVAPPPGQSNQAVVFQNTGTAVANGAALFAQFDAGHLAGTYRRLSVLVHEQDFSDLAVCTFWLPPTATLARYGVRLHTTKAWTNASISIYAASAGAANEQFFIDNVSLQLQPSGTVERTDCLEPAGVEAPGGAAGPNLLVNGDFASGSTSPGWTTFGQIQSNVTGGVFQFIKLAGAPAGVILQSTSQAMTARQILTATLDLGNSSGVRKRVTVIVHDSDFSDLAACTFWLPAGQALSSYTMRLATTKAWANATISIYPATTGSEQWIRLDNVTLQRTPSVVVVGTECVETAAGGDQGGQSAPWTETGGSAANGAANAGVTLAGRQPGAAGTDPLALAVADDSVWVADGFAAADVAAPGDTTTGWTAETDSAPATLTTRDAFDPSVAGTRLLLQSWLSTGTARIDISTDDGPWETIGRIAPSDTWMPIEHDLASFAGRAIRVRLVLEPAGDGAATWRVGTVVLTH